MKLLDAKDLRVFRKKALSSIVFRDLGNKDPPAALMAEWSGVADHLIASALKIVLKEFEAPPEFCVIALGKLGGRELNYSSDVDLLYIYEGDLEAASKVANRLTRMLDDITEDGFVFRVDNNLRPEGSRGPIVNTVDALERYYEKTGEEWERQALIRARPVAGNAVLGNEFIKRVRPFVFRRYIAVSALKKIRATKLKLEKSASEEGWNNIKLGPGGIREVEFIVQALQMLNGGKIEELRVANIFEVLALLKKHKIISVRKHDDLLEAYTLLRRAENIMQAKDDRQIHTLPSASPEKDELAKKLGFKSQKDFTVKLDKIRHNVQRHFSSIFETSYEKTEILEAMEANISTCKNEEEIIDSLPWFKNHIVKRIQEDDLEGKLSIDDVSERLIILAETIADEALKIGRHKLTRLHGTPRMKDNLSAEMVVVGMGKLGSKEMDYASDLDLIFIYAGDGETDGEKSVTNHEYFTKLAQNVLSVLTLPTRYGRTYSIDAKLRPSGNQGVLVSSIEAFRRYHLREASFWERQALLKTRVVAGDVLLSRKFKAVLDDLIYNQPLPPDIKSQIAALREKTICEKTGGSGYIDVKYGAGGMADFEAIVHLLLFVHGCEDPGVRNLDALHKQHFITDEDYAVLNEAYSVYRKLLSRIRLFVIHPAESIATDADYFQAACTSLGFSDKNALIGKLNNLMRKTREIYLRFLK